MTRMTWKAAGSGFRLLLALCVSATACGPSAMGMDPGVPPEAKLGTQSQTIGAAGGKVALPDLTLDIPAGALSADTEITLTHVPENAEGASFLSTLYVLSPAGLTFNQPITASVTLSSPPPPTATLNWSDAADPTLLRPVATTISGNTVSGSNTHFSSIVLTATNICGVDRCTAPIKPVSIKITASNTFVTKGATLQLTGQSIYADGRFLIIPGPAAWSSSSPAVATVDANGLVKGVGPGTATITLVSGTLQATIKIVVVAFHQAGGFDGPIYALAAGTGPGAFYAGGEYQNYLTVPRQRMSRLNSDGTADLSFNPMGGANSTVRSVALAMDGTTDVFVGGDFTAFGPGPVAVGIVRLNSSGVVNAAFNSNAGTGFAPLTRVNCVTPVTTPAGALYVGGRFSTYNGTPSKNLIRLKGDGSVDTSFNVGSGFDLQVNSIVAAPSPAGAIYVAGEFTSYQGVARGRIIRLLSNGMPDGTFDVQVGFDNPVLSMALAKDGTDDLYVGGMFTAYRGSVVSQGIVRLRSNGSLDPVFNPSGTVGVNAAVYSLLPAADGSNDVYLGGSFTTYRGTPRSRLVRANRDGSIDTSFDIGTGFGGNGNPDVYAQVFAPDGSGDLYVGGFFPAYKGVNVNYIVRLSSSGESR